jgi:hypothetical protein
MKAAAGMQPNAGYLITTRQYSSTPGLQDSSTWATLDLPFVVESKKEKR